MADFPETGKVQNNFFEEIIFPYCGSKRDEVQTGPGFGVDVAIVKLPNGLDMALSSDPLSLIPTLGLRESAWLSVHLTANDIATTGKAPMYAQFVLNLQPNLSAADFEAYWKYIHEDCKEIGVAITGGHSGRFEGQNSTVAGGATMISIAEAGSFLTSKGGSAGDVVIVTKESALVATAILALSFPETVKNRCGLEHYQNACSLFYQTSALKDALIAAEVKAAVTAMHDVTEGGLIGAIYELAYASGCGLLIEADKLPVGETQKAIGKIFEFDPRYCIGAGSMIITAKKEKAEGVINKLQADGIKATVVGELTVENEGKYMIENDQKVLLEHPGTDPYWAAFFKAFKQSLT